MPHARRSRQHCYRFAAGVVLALACGGTQAPTPLEFTRPTIIAVTLDAEPRTNELHFEDGAYRFVSQNYGTAGREERPGFFVYSKTRGRWIEILGLSTEHARLGRSPSDLPLPIGWDYGHLIGEPFTRELWAPGRVLNYPDRVLDWPSPPAYRLDFNSNLKREVSLTWLWLLKSDLDAAFDGRRTPSQVAPDDGLDIRMDLSDGIVVPVRVNQGDWLRWKIDAKAPGIILDGMATRLPAPRNTKPERVDLMVGPVAMANQPVVRGSASAHNNIGGLLGTALFDRFAVSIDYDRGRIRLLDPHAVESRPADVTVPIRWGTGAAIVTGQLDGAGAQPANVRLCVDTAEPRPLVLRQNVGAARLRSLRFGSFRFDDLPVVDSTVPSGCDGVLGNGLLKRFRVIFDRPRQRLLLHPGALIDVPYDYDLTGLTIVANGRAFGISSVAGDSIAHAAGLRAGDVIVELDSRAVSGMTLAELRRSFRHDGRRRTLTIQRHGTTEVVTLPMPILAP